MFWKSVLIASESRAQRKYPVGVPLLQSFQDAPYISGGFKRGLNQEPPGRPDLARPNSTVYMFPVSRREDSAVPATNLRRDHENASIVLETSFGRLDNFHPHIVPLTRRGLVFRCFGEYPRSYETVCEITFILFLLLTFNFV